MSRWLIDFFEDEAGNRTVRYWLDALPEVARVKLLAGINLLAEHGPTLDYPFTSQVEGRLRELRVRAGRTRYRVLYFSDRNRTAILLHGLLKGTAALGEADKRVARKRMALHEARLAVRERRVPGEEDLW